MKKTIAIRIHNEKQYNSLMNHYESKGWKWVNGYSPKAGNRYKDVCNPHTNNTVQYCDNFFYNAVEDESTIIDFSDFAEITGIEVVNDIIVKLA